MITNYLLQMPIPRDIPLPLPLPEWLLVIILIVSFLLHILFINLMVGSTLLTFWYQIKGLKSKDYDKLAREIATTITVNKSMAVVLGVAPLLSINVLYTFYFYSSNAITGNMWISIVPWVAVSFLIVYLHKYTWDKLENNKMLHIGILSFALVSFLLIPFIFLTNINLMLFPEKWVDIYGFVDALILPNVFTRYLHFITASLAITGLFLAVYFGRKSFKFNFKFEFLNKELIKKQMITLMLLGTGIQFIFGPLLFLTLPSKGISWNLFWVILAGVIIAVIVLVQLWKMANRSHIQLGKQFNVLIVLFVLLVLCMGTGRHMYRENALATHKGQMAERTRQHWEMVKKAHENLLLPETGLEEGEIMPGLHLFQVNCAICHSATTRLVGPPMAEVAPEYLGKNADLKSWIKKPGRKRMDYPQMTGFPQLNDQQLSDLAEYVINEEWN